MQKCSNTKGGISFSLWLCLKKDVPNHCPKHIFFRRILSAKVNDLAHFFGDIKSLRGYATFICKMEKNQHRYYQDKKLVIFRNIASYFVHTSAKGYLYSKYY